MDTSAGWILDLKRSHDDVRGGRPLSTAALRARTRSGLRLVADPVDGVGFVV